MLHLLWLCPTLRLPVSRLACAHSSRSDNTSP